MLPEKQRPDGQFTKWNLRWESAVEAEFFVPLVCDLVVRYAMEFGGEHCKEASLYEPSQSICPFCQTDIRASYAYGNAHQLTLTPG